MIRRKQLRMKKTFGFIIFLLLTGCINNNNHQASDFEISFLPSVNLAEDFLNPPDYARPRAFWWWLEGYMTKQGVLDDLTAMKEAGILGVIIFDAGSSSYYTDRLTPHNAAKRTQPGPGFMTPQWRELFTYSCHVADSLGIEISLNITSGWNDGGPWVTPKYASQKLVWSETLVEGGQKIDRQLPLPDKLLTYEGDNKPYFMPVAVLAMKLMPDADSIEALPEFNIKAVHSISIPQTPNKLGFDWEALVRPLPANLKGCHARLDDIIDVSKYVDADGNIKWDAPAGRYSILRFGHTGTGVRVSTTSPGAGGLAIDYMSAGAMELQFDNVVKPLLDDLEKIGGKSLRYLHDDSWELGAANWTPLMEKEFESLNGYEIRKYLPVIAGKIIDSHDISDRFLYDFRRTIADLIMKNHYKCFKDLANSKGLGIHPESGGPHPAPIDALRNFSQSDIVMGEFWGIANTHRVEPHTRLFVKQGASAAHIYGKRFMQAEGPSSIGPHWERDPWTMKSTMDIVFCEGLNRFVIHTFTHSPKEAGKPGNEYFAGTHLNSNITWWKQGKAFFDWSARNSFMLSQGLFVADVAFYYGDNVPNQVPLKHIDPRLGEGYDYDVVNTDVILNRMTAHDGKIFLPDGMSYNVLVIPDRKSIKTEVLQKIEQLVKNGATVIGPKPETTVGLQKMEYGEKQIDKIAIRLWGNIDGTNITENAYGKGKTVWGKDIRKVLTDKGIVPDFEYLSSRNLFPDENRSFIDYIHRNDGETHIFYVVNRNEQTELLNCSFRVENKQPELWYPETGKITLVNVYTVQNGQISIPLYLDPYGSVFVVFRNPAKDNRITSISKDGVDLFPNPSVVPVKAPFTFLPDGNISFSESGKYSIAGLDGVKEVLVDLPAYQPVKSVWKLSFDPEWGGPTNTEFKKLISWTEHPDAGIKYYSGTAVYRNSFKINESEAGKYRIYLNLGELYNLAEIKINGQTAGVWWKKSFSGDITELVKQGENTLEISVVNLWPNRLVGDQFLPEDKRYTKTNVVKFTKDYPLLPSGLIGPVDISFGMIYKYENSK